jgi:hypothetical protein
LRVGTVTRSALVVDFDFTGRQEAGFRHFAEVSDIDQEIWQVTQPAGSTRDLISAEQYLNFWANLPGEMPRSVDAVFGYCAGCSFLPELVRRIARTQDRPPALLLFAPEPIAVTSLYQDFRKTVDAMSILSAQEKRQLLIEAGKICDNAVNSFATAARDVISLYEEAVYTAFARLSLDESLQTEFAEIFRSYVSYLAAASELSPEDGWQSGIALTSRQSNPGAKHASREISFPVAASDLLRDPRVADAVFDLLDEIRG